MTDTDLVRTLLDSPIGPLTVVADPRNAAIVALYTAEHRLAARCGGVVPSREPAVVGQLRRELTEYFAGVRQRFELPLAPRGSAFAQQIWRALAEVPYGATTSYAALAQAIGRDARSARAVGRANATNPLSIVVPCHRIVGASGALTGYAGGLAAKRWLLAHERAHARPLREAI